MALYARQKVKGAALMGEYPDWLQENLVMANKLLPNRENFLQRALINLQRFPNDPVLNNRVQELQLQVAKLSRFTTDPIRYKRDWDTNMEGLYRQVFRADLGNELVFY